MEKKQCNLGMCGVQRPVQLECTEKSLCHTRQHGPPRSKRVSSTRYAARNLRQLDQKPDENSLQSIMNFDDDIRKDLHVEARDLRETAQKHGDACSGWLRFR